MAEIDSIIRKITANSNEYLEFRYHNRASRSLGVRKGEVNDMSYRETCGLAVRALVKGAWGFASTSDLTRTGIERAVSSARSMAASLASRRKEKIQLADTDALAVGEFNIDGYNDLLQMPLAEKFDLVRSSENRMRSNSKGIESAACHYTEVFEEKYIKTTDGADCWIRLVRPELRLSAYASGNGRVTRGYDSIGATGGWQCLFQNRSIDEYIDSATGSARTLLDAPGVQGGRTKVILSPAMVGLLSHEAIGHTVEADFVLAGSVAQGKLGQKVASDLITLCDSGASEYTSNAGGELPVDDEGVRCEKSVLIEKGILTGYLHNRETAGKFGARPRGNARAWEYNDEPLIRMRNTYIEPGNDELTDMIAGIEEGLYIDGPEGGQADATGEFMFGASRVRKIKNGQLAEHVQKVTVSGSAFDVLSSVDAVSKDFKWDLGSGHCGKGQPAKVDAGGPYLRCEILVGGEQS